MPVHVQMMARISLRMVSTISDGNAGNQGMHDPYVKIKEMSRGCALDAVTSDRDCLRFTWNRLSRRACAPGAASP